MFRNILVHIPSERPVRPVIDVAVALSIVRRSHLDAVAIGYESMGGIGLLAEGGGAAVAAVMGAEPGSPKSPTAPKPSRRSPPRRVKSSERSRDFTT